MPNQDINEIFTMNLKRLMTENNTTYSSLAKSLGVSRSTISMWVTGKSLPRMELLDKIADLFGVSVSDLTTDNNCFDVRQDFSKMYEVLKGSTLAENIQPINHVTTADLSAMYKKLMHYAELLNGLNPDELNDVQHYVEFVKSKRTADE